MASRRIGPFILIACAIIVNSVTEEIVDPGDIKKLTTPTPSFQAYENWTDWESWEPSADIAQGHPRYRSGYDLDGLVGTQVPIAARYAWTRVMATKILIDFNEQYEVHVIEAGVLDERKWATASKEKQEEFWKAYEYWTRREEKDATFNNNQGIVLILDLDGFALKNSASPAALQADMKMFSMIFRQNNAVKYGFVINVNFGAESFINLSKPLWGDLLSRFEIYGTRREKWIPKLLRKIDASQLPPKYGGSKDWKPLNFTEYQPLGQ